MELNYVGELHGDGFYRNVLLREKKPPLEIRQFRITRS